MPLMRALVVASLCALPAHAADICVTNGSDRSLLFVADPDSTDQVAAQLAPHETLCAPAQGRGTVRAFLDAQAAEGCARRVVAGQTETLIDFVAFDNCRWSAHDD